MRYSSVITAVAATAPLAVSATGQLGYALGSRRSDGKCKTQSDYAADLAVLKDTSKIVRTYSNVDAAIPSPVCQVPGALLPAAQAASFQVILGIWADTKDSYEADRDELFKYASNYSSTIYAVTVGSEALYRYEHSNQAKGCSSEDLAFRINDTKSARHEAGLNFMVGTAESWNKFQDKTADNIIPIADILLVNAFGYWQQQLISNATATYLDDLQQAFGRIQTVSGSTEKPVLWNGETGWPTDGGSNYGAAIASTKNAYYFWKQGVCAALDWNISLFYFSGFDEEWKPDSTGADGQPGDEKHWGAFKNDRSPKFDDYSCKYLVPGTS